MRMGSHYTNQTVRNYVKKLSFRFGLESRQKDKVENIIELVYGIRYKH